MKIKIYVIIGLLLSISILVIVNNDVDVIATPGGGGNGEENSIGLDYDFMWEVTENLSNVVHDPDIYPDGTIHKGRKFGSDGDRWTSGYLHDLMKFNLSLENVEKDLIHTLPLLYPLWFYNYIIDAVEYNLTINGDGYPYPHTVPLNETYAQPSVVANSIPFTSGFGSINYNNSFTNLKIVPFNLMEELNLTINYLKISTDNITEYNETIGNATYIPINSSIPGDQEYRVFLLEEKEGVNEQLENITSNASAVILIHTGDYQANTSKCNTSIITRTQNNDNNITTIIELLENSTQIVADNLDSNETITFSYNANYTNWPWCDDDFFYVTPHNYYGYGITDDNFKNITIRNFWENILFGTGAACHGIIAYDIFNETHLMWAPLFFWPGKGDNAIDQVGQFLVKQPRIQMFLVNYSVGKWLWDNASNATVSGYFKQAQNWTEAYNVIGEITNDGESNNPHTIISGRYDAMESEAPGDSGAGVGIVLGIAKYFKDYNIKPKFDLTFLFTTGEEYGFRGAYYFSHTHPFIPPFNWGYYIKQWIGTDQLGFNQADSYLNPLIQPNASISPIIKFIAEESEYANRSEYGYNSTDAETVGAMTDDFAFRMRPINKPMTICIGKDAEPCWFGHHRAGMNFQEGDSLNNIDREDLNYTFEFAWNVTKYFCVDPDCWFEDCTINDFDSPEDNGNYSDSVNITYSIKTILPHDKIRVEAVLQKSQFPWPVVVNSTTIDYYINSSGIQNTIIFTIPENGSEGCYKCTLYLYNSTGRIKKILELSGDYYNDTFCKGMHLYPWNYNKTGVDISDICITSENIATGCDSEKISATVTSTFSEVTQSQVFILYPDGSFMNYNMDYLGGDAYEYVFNNFWQNGQYFYCICGEDENGNFSGSEMYSFNVSAMATVTVCTIQDEYSNNTIVNVTDPPGDPPSVGYELLDDGKVLRIWNNYDSYYFNTTSGIQLTNHYNKYWSHNVLMLGYYNNNQWHLIYRTDELSGFNKNIDSDNETYVNATLWKDLTYQGYNFRLAIRYYLGVNDKELTVIPYIKNLGQAIPYNLGFAWEIKDIQVDMTPQDDYIEINGTTYLLNQSLDETYKNMTMSCFYIREDISSDRSQSLYLCWNDSLDYLVKVKSRDGQYNAPVTLGIKIGTLAAGQEKYTSLLWHDASEITYYFNSYNIGETWASNPSYMVDDSTSTYASTTANGDVELCNGNSCNGLNLGNITKVELRAYGYYSGAQRDIILRPVFSGTTDGLNYYYSTVSSPAWSRWFDITTDPYKTLAWSWTDVDNLDCDVEAKSNIGFFTLYCSKVEIRVTYIPNSNPVISNPYPADGSIGVSIAPLLNITVSDDNGDSMNITWLSNSSGSWQVFGTNNSIGNGTYHQIISNASTNGKWWYWKVNVTDGINYTESSVYKFYTGNQSKIKNTGSTNISGYLLMQVQFFDAYNWTWTVAVDNSPNETTPRTILVGEQFGLDTVFNNKINTADLIDDFGIGLYRVYACFRDPYGNVLVCDNDSLMETTYEFTVNL